MIDTVDFDVQKVREQFPVLFQQVHGKDLIYFDNAATAQKPKSVLDALAHYYQNDNSNIHRGVHSLAERATHDFEETRKASRAFINANEVEEVIFTKGTTEGINLIAQSYGRKFLKAGDEIIISELEHHSNIVPWQILAQQTGAVIKVIPVLPSGELNLETYKQLLSDRTKIVAFNYISNSLGTINPVKDMIAAARDFGAKTVIDAAQAAPHLKIDVKDLNCDFLALSGHKMYGPTGVGILYGKRSVLEKMDPYQGGGEMIKEVSFSGTSYNEIPYKFEAGTPNIAGVVALKKAIDFVEGIGQQTIAAHEDKLLVYATDKLNEIASFDPVGVAKNKASVISFNLKGVHPFDLGMFLDAKGIAVRTGHHCTQPIMDKFGIEGTARASFAVYNTKEEIDIFVQAVSDIESRFNKSA